jgi:hypothetical protein
MLFERHNFIELLIRIGFHIGKVPEGEEKMEFKGCEFFG